MRKTKNMSKTRLSYSKCVAQKPSLRAAGQGRRPMTQQGQQNIGNIGILTPLTVFSAQERPSGVTGTQNRPNFTRLGWALPGHCSWIYRAVRPFG